MADRVPELLANRIFRSPLDEELRFLL